MPLIRFVIIFMFSVGFLYCTFSIIYLFLFSVLAKLFSSSKIKNEILVASAPAKRIAILVPAYKEDEIIIYTARNLLQLDYPPELFDIYIIADSFRPETLINLRTLPLFVMEVSFTTSTKSKSLNEGFRRISKVYDIALICDGDNFLEKDFLRKVNNHFLHGTKAAQGRRVPKNTETPFAILDACSEAINNSIYRRGPNTIGLSSSLAGSGMAFEYDLIRQIMSEIQIVGGFDKIVQVKLVQQRISIEYIPDAIIYDEKIDTAYDFSKQRKRWLSSQFFVFKKLLFPAFKELFRGNINYFNLAFVNNFLLPNSLYLIMLPLLILASFVIRPVMGIYSVCLLLLFITSLIIALPPYLINRNLINALLRMPKAIGLMVIAVFHVRKPNEKFLHTRHSKKHISITISEKSRK